MRLTYPKGLLGHVVQYVEDTARLPDRWISLATALSACAKSMDRKFLGPDENSTVLWLMLIAETGAGKQHGLNCIRTVLKATVSERSLVASGLGSVQGIEEIIEGTKTIDPQPNPLVVIDEVGAWLKRISSKGQTGNVSEIPGSLQGLWGFPPAGEWVGSKTKGKEMTVVYGPAFSIYGVSTEEKFVRALTGEQISNGFVNRMILFDVGRGAEEVVDPKYSWMMFPEWLAKALREVVGPPAPDSGPLVLKDGAFVARDFRRVGWGDGVRERHRKYENSMRAIPSLEERELWIRAPENALRVAEVHAVFRGSMTVEHEDLDWGIAIIEQSMRWLMRALRKHRTDDLEQIDLVEKVRGEFRKLVRKDEGRC
jgi:hypothetical protein